MALCGKTSSGVVLIALVYLVYNLYNVYTIFNPPACAPNQIQNCIKPAHPKDVKLQLWVYLSTIKSTFSSRAKLLYHNNSFYRTDEIKTTLQVDIPSSVYKKNGTFYAHVFLGPQELTPEVYEERYHLSYSVVPLTKHSVPTSTAFNLLSDSKEDNSTLSVDPVTHWVPFLHIHSLAEDWRFDSHKVPHELWDYLRVFEGPLRYLPPLYVDRLKVTKKQLVPIESNMTLDLLYAPVSIGKFRLWLIFASTLDNMGALGFKDKEFDDLKGIFLETNFWLFGLTIFISVFHLLFDFLAFKNDISFWRKHKTMVGLSLRTIIWRCFSQLIVFLYLMDQKSSLLVLIPTGIGSVIEFWKVSKALKISVTWSGIIPKFKFGEKGEEEKMSESFDSEAMNKLFYVLAPLVVLGAAYQLVNSSFTSWYSWVIQSLVNGVYAFGFLFMLPQLFLNYKLKSVAHLPWKAFMYKAFNTFIDDVFAFIITMPTAHRLAVFRDDIVFLVYLYQRWLYPVDKSRTNEFGQSFDSEGKQTEDQNSKPKRRGKRKDKAKHKRKAASQGSGDAEASTKAKEVEKTPSNRDSNDDEMRVSDSDDGGSDDNTRSCTTTAAEDDSDSETEVALDTKEQICDRTSEEAKVGTEGIIHCSGSAVGDKLKSE